ncbi:MAG: C40 family peptidase [Deltaproteobacteria bacterium]|nr:C40 family peptidase [Deltaproteobacteria bacterium]
MLAKSRPSPSRLALGRRLPLCLSLSLALWLFLPASSFAESFKNYVPPNVKIADRKDRPSAQEILRHASTFLGTRYVWGSCEIPPGVDCSGFMIRVWSDMGYALPRVSRMQAQVGIAVDPEKLEPADLLFFTSTPGDGKITHVGMYIGNGEFIHAAQGSMKVSVNSLSGYFRRHFSHARRILPLGPGWVVEADQSTIISKPLPDAPKKPPHETPKSPPSKKEKEDADKLLEGVELPQTDVYVPESDEVRIGDMVVEDEALADQLRGVDTNDPNQFEHAGQTPPPFFSLMTDAFAGAALPQGPRYLTRNEHAVSLHLGSGPVPANYANAALVPGALPRYAFFFSPELNLKFENAGVRLNLGFPMGFALVGGNEPARGQFLVASQPNAWRDYTRALRLVQYGEEEGGLYFALNRFATTTTGHGHLVRNLSPSLASPYIAGSELGHVPLTWHGDVNLEAVSLETHVDDVFDPRVMSARVGVRPWQIGNVRTASLLLKTLTFALEYAADWGPNRALPTTNLAGTDLEAVVWQTKVHQTDLYAGASLAIPGGIAAPTLGMAKGTLGTLWRFKLGATAAHSLRARLELGFGRARDTWIDNFEYVVAAGLAPVSRSPSVLSLLASLNYSYRETFEIGSTYVPAMPATMNTVPTAGAHKLESHIGTRDLAVTPKVRLNLQLLHQMLVYDDAATTNVHYLLADAHVIAVRFLKVGFVARKQLGLGFSQWDVMADLAGEIPF